MYGWTSRHVALVQDLCPALENTGQQNPELGQPPYCSVSRSCRCSTAISAVSAARAERRIRPLARALRADGSSVSCARLQAQLRILPVSGRRLRVRKAG